jgi:cell wall assembly regulator SMI1
MEKTFSPTNIEAINTFEKQIGYTLPDVYKEFLLQYNGGRPDNKNNTFYILQQSGSDILNFFFGLNIIDFECYDLLTHRSWMVGRMPISLLCIGSDPGGNLICISLAIKTYGQIYFWDHELEGSVNVFFLSNSFEEFVNSLEDEEYYDEDDI